MIPNIVKEFTEEVLGAFSTAQHLFTDPKFLIRFAFAAVEIATAPDDEARRGVAQAELLKIKREFA